MPHGQTKMYTSTTKVPFTSLLTSSNSLGPGPGQRQWIFNGYTGLETHVAT